jgi:hypothetical protein
VHHLDFIDICAILLGILFTVAKLDAQGRRHENFAHVPLAEFERWRNWTTSIYRLGAAGCFGRVLFHQGWSLYVGRQTLTTPAAPKSLVIPALLIDAAFVAILISTFVRASRARALRRELGIVVAPISPQQAAAMSDKDDGGDKDA